MDSVVYSFPIAITTPPWRICIQSISRIYYLSSPGLIATGISDAGSKFATGVVDTGGK